MFYHVKTKKIETVIKNITFQLLKYNITISWSIEEVFFDQIVKNNLRTHDNIKKTATGQGDNYPTRCLLDYLYFKEYHKLISIDLSKQQKLDAVPKAIQKINFAGNLDNNATRFFITDEAKKGHF